MKLINEERLAELLREEARLSALEVGNIFNYTDSKEGKAYLKISKMSDDELTKDFEDLDEYIYKNYTG